MLDPKYAGLEKRIAVLRDWLKYIGWKQQFYNDVVLFHFLCRFYRIYFIALRSVHIQYSCAVRIHGKSKITGTYRIL